MNLDSASNTNSGPPLSQRKERGAIAAQVSLIFLRCIARCGSIMSVMSRDIQTLQIELRSGLTIAIEGL